MGNERVLILWDIDGTLLDTQGAGVIPLVNSIEKKSKSKINFNRSEFAGWTDYEIIEYFCDLSVGPLSFEELDSILFDYAEGLKSNLKKRPANLLGDTAKSLFHLSRNEKYILGILSGNCERGGNAKLHSAKIQDFFDPRNRYFANFSLKTRNQILESAVSQNEKVIVIGDSPYDIHAAQNHEVPVISLATGFFSFEELNLLNRSRVMTESWRYEELLVLLESCH